jgi:hypothetical protein
MTGMMMTINTDGTVTTKEYKKVPPSIDEMQKAVGGYIETVPYFTTIYSGGQPHACVAFCNEEGKIIGLDHNPSATTLWHELVPHMRGQDVLSGPVIIVWGDDTFMEAL